MMRDSYTRSAHEVYIRSPHHFKEPGHLLEPDDPADLWRIDVPAKKIIWRRNLRQQLYDDGYPQTEAFIPKYCHMETYLHYAIIFGMSSVNPFEYGPYAQTDYAPYAPFVARIDTTDGRLLDWRFLPGEWSGPDVYGYYSSKWEYWYPYDAGILYAYATVGWPRIYIFRGKNEAYGSSGYFKYWDQMLVLNTESLATLSVLDLTEPFEHPYRTGDYVSPAIYDWCADRWGIYWLQNYLDWEDKPGSPGEIQSIAGVKSHGLEAPSGLPINISYTYKQIADACGFQEGYYWSTQYPSSLYGHGLHPGGNGYPVMRAAVGYWETSWGWELGNTIPRMVLIRFDVGIWKTWCLGNNPQPQASTGNSIEFSRHKMHPFCIAWTFTQPVREEGDPLVYTNESKGFWLYKQDMSDATKLLGPDWYEYWADFEGYCWQSLAHFRVCRPPNSYEPGTPVEIVGAWALNGDLIWNNLLGHDGPFFPYTDVKAIASVTVYEAVIAGELLAQSEGA